VDKQNLYPQFIESSIKGLRQDEFTHRRDVMALFSSLRNFLRDLQECKEIEEVLDLMETYLQRLDMFSANAFYRVRPEDFTFECALCEPDESKEKIEGLVKLEIQAGRFAWALHQARPVIFDVKVD
jgi:hypothetical protein